MRTHKKEFAAGKQRKEYEKPIETEKEEVKDDGVPKGTPDYESHRLFNLVESLGGVGELRYEQDDAVNFGAFISLVDGLKHCSDVLWFANIEPRRDDSTSRNLIEEGPLSFNDLDVAT